MQLASRDPKIPRTLTESTEAQAYLAAQHEPATRQVLLLSLQMGSYIETEETGPLIAAVPG